MKALISLMLVTSIVGAQEVRAPQRGEERREPSRVERPEPVRSHPPVQEERRVEPPRQVEPRPQPPVDRPSMGRPNGGVVILDTWGRNRDCWNCRNPWIMMQMDINRRQQMNRPRPPRPPRVEMARQRWESLTPKQQKQLMDARQDFREKVQKILNNP
jgi:hypothetical protein